MRTLVIDTATRACSVALFEDGNILGHVHELIGRGHAEKLLPFIESLPGKGRADEIYVNVGPGSFTGIRVGVAAAKALAFAWSAPCHGYNCLNLVAAMAGGDSVDQNHHVDVAMTGGHGEYYFQEFCRIQAAGPPLSLEPEKAAARSKAPIVAGDMATEIVRLRGDGEAVTILPDARCWPSIAGLDPLPPRPLYIRPPDAKPAAGKTA